MFGCDCAERHWPGVSCGQSGAGTERSKPRAKRQNELIKNGHGTAASGDQRPVVTDDSNSNSKSSTNANNNRQAMRTELLVQESAARTQWPSRRGRELRSQFSDHCPLGAPIVHWRGNSLVSPASLGPTFVPQRALPLPKAKINGK